MAIVFWESDEVALIWDSITPSSRPNWFGCYEDLNLEWRVCDDPKLTKSIGSRLEDVIVVENCETLQVVQSPLSPKNLGEQHSKWAPYALSFRFGGSVLTVFNALDENGLSNELPVAEYLRHSSIRAMPC